MNQNPSPETLPSHDDESCCGRCHAPNRERWAVAAVLSTAALAAGMVFDFWNSEALLSGRDIVSHEYLMWKWGWASFFEHGQLPQWNPHLFGGYPFIASFSFCPYYPLGWPFIALPAALAITGRFALSLAVGAMGFYAFARSVRVRPPLAFAMALMYESGSHVASLAFPGHINKIEAIVWVPWAMAAAVLLARWFRVRHAVFLGAAWAMQLLASHTQIFYATFWMAALYVGIVATGRAIEKKSLRPLGAAAGLLGLAGILTVGLSAVQMFPALEMARQSNRAAGVDWKTASFGALPADELAEIVLPSFRGDSTGSTLQAVGGPGHWRNYGLRYKGTWHADENGQGAERLVSDYVGVWPALLALAGLVWGAARKKWIFFAFAGVFALISIGDATPLFHWAYQCVPGFNKFRSPATFMIGLHFSLFALAALGIEGFARRIDSSNDALRTRFQAILLLAGTIFILTWGRIGIFAANPDLTELSGSELPEKIRDFWFNHSLLHTTFFLALGSFALSFVVRFRPFTLTIRKPSKKWGALAAFVFLGVAILDGALQARRFIPKGAGDKLEFSFLMTGADSAILDDAKGSLLPAVMDEGNELSNRPMARGLRTPHGYHPIVYADYEKLLQACGYNSPVLLRHFGVNHHVFDPRKPPHYFGVTRPNLMGANGIPMPPTVHFPEGWSPMTSYGGRQILKRDNPIPFARVPRRVEALHKKWDSPEMDLEAWRSTIGNENFYPGETTLCEGDYEWTRLAETGSSSTTTLTASASVPSVRSEMLRPDEFRFQLEEGASWKDVADAEGFVPCLLPIPAGSGWRVRIEDVDGVNKPDGWPRRANGFFLLVPLSAEPGARTVLTYSPTSSTLGFALSMASLLALSLSFMAYRARRYSRRDEGASR